LFVPFVLEEFIDDIPQETQSTGIYNTAFPNYFFIKPRLVFMQKNKKYINGLLLRLQFLKGVC